MKHRLAAAVVLAIGGVAVGCAAQPAMARHGAIPHRAYGGTPIDVTTYHYDSLRTGWNQSETDLTPASVASGKFGVLATLAVDGLVIAQPLIVSNFTLPDGSTHNLLIIVTSNDSVYAFDAQTYAVVWQVSLGTAQNAADVHDTALPQYGISSTPVIVRAAQNAATIYLVAATEPAPMTFLHQLHALNVATGQDMLTPVTLSATANVPKHGVLNFNPQVQWSRAGLAYDRGNIYIGITSHGDHDRTVISGWLLDYSTQLQQVAAFHSSDAHGGLLLGSVWMSGFAPAIDADGNIFFATGNGQVVEGDVTSSGQSVLSLSPGLGTVNSSFTPSDWAALNAADSDLGAGGVMLLPPQSGQTAPPLAVAMGKKPLVYLLNQTQLGGLQNGDAGALQELAVQNAHGVWGGPAYYSGPAGSFVYYQPDAGLLQSFAVSAGTPPALSLAAESTVKGGYRGTVPVVSSNGATADTALIWVVGRRDPLVLEAYNAVTLGTPIYSAPAGNWRQGRGVVNAFVPPLVANGCVYVPSYLAVTVFGLAP